MMLILLTVVVAFGVLYAAVVAEERHLENSAKLRKR
jgi:hypothetical protein